MNGSRAAFQACDGLQGDPAMILFLLAYLGGVLTILSPCILAGAAFRVCKRRQA